MQNELSKRNWLDYVITALCAGTALFHIITSYFGALDVIRHRSLRLTLIMAICFLISARKKREKKVTFIASILFAVLTIVGGMYVFVEGNMMPLRSGNPTQLDIIIGIIFILLVIEATRRTTGLAMSIICVFFIVYTMFGQYFPGFLRHAPYSLENIINEQFIELSGLWGVSLGMSATFIIIFVIFGEFLNQMGITEVFMQLANKLMGATVGATAKVATVISVFVGSITGSAAASVMVTGSMTIKGMKQAGYDDEFTAAVQAIGGTGGQVMPPVMGSAAFLIAAFIGIPYIEVCKSALIPAVLFYFCLFSVVHFKSRKLKMQPASGEEFSNVTWKDILKKSYLFLPLVILTWLLFVGASPMRAGFMGLVVMFIIGIFDKERRFTLKKIIAAFEGGITSAISVTMSCAAAGIIVGCIMQSGLGYTISASLVRLSGGHAYILAVLVLIACLILGMGMTTVSAYIIVSSLVSPALISAGIEPIAAHMFPFYFAILSAITPPVAVAAYASAGMTNTNPWRVGLKSFYYSIPIFTVPFIFFGQPELLFIGSPVVTIFTTIVTGFAIMMFCGGQIGFFIADLNIVQRILLVTSAVLIFQPMVWLELVGVALGVFAVLWVISVKKRQDKISSSSSNSV